MAAVAITEVGTAAASVAITKIRTIARTEAGRTAITKVGTEVRTLAIGATVGGVQCLDDWEQWQREQQRKYDQGQWQRGTAAITAVVKEVKSETEGADNGPEM